MKKSGGKLFPAFGPSPLDNSLSGTGTHPHPETMGTFSLQIGGLKCSLAHLLILVFNFM